MGLTGSDASLVAALITGISQVGLACGSFASLSLMNRVGKRRSLIFANCIGAIGVAFTLVKNIYFICIGRIILGASVGVLQVVGPSYIIETVPD